MTHVLQLGPLALPLPLLVGFAAIGLGFVAGKRASRTLGFDIEPQLFRVLVVGLVVARLAFVLQWREAYLRAPLGILDIRDGGWDIAVGGAAAFVYALSLVKRAPRLKRPLVAAGATTATLAVIGTIALVAWPGPQPGLPSVALQSPEGKPVALQAFAGKPTVVNLWASWCPPCRREMPVLQQAQAAHPDVNFVFVNQGESAGKVVAFLGDQQLELQNVLLDLQLQAGSRLGRVALPTTLFFDSGGRLVSSRVGELSYATLLHRLAGLGAGDGARGH